MVERTIALYGQSQTVAFAIYGNFPVIAAVAYLQVLKVGGYWILWFRSKNEPYDMLQSPKTI